MNKTTKSLLGSWTRTFVASSGVGQVLLGSKAWTPSKHEALAILCYVGAATATTVYNYFNPRDPRFGKAIAFVAKGAEIVAKDANLSAPVAADVAAVGDYLGNLATENSPVAQATPVTPGA